MLYRINDKTRKLLEAGAELDGWGDIPITLGTIHAFNLIPYEIRASGMYQFTLSAEECKRIGLVSSIRRAWSIKKSWVTPFIADKLDLI
jgi:hypothetical protein